MDDDESTKSQGCTLESIAEDNEFFKRMLAMVPANTFQLDQQSGDSEEEDEEVEDPREAAKEKKRLKKEKHKQKKEKKKHKRELPQETEDADSNSFTHLKNKKQKLEPVGSSSGPNTESPTSLVPSQPGSLLSTSIADLETKRAKLRAKIQELQAKRKLNDRDRQNKKKLKRQESKMKLKQKRKQEKMLKMKPHIANGGDVSKGSNSVPVTKTPTKPIYNKEGQMVFSKFDFTDSGKKEKGKHNDLSGKDYKRLLEKIEKRNERIKKVKSRDEDAGKSLQDKFKWESVLNKAEGQKVKDDPELLKKSLKRKEKMKEKKKKKWEDRTRTVEKQQSDKQKKRTINIQKRKQAVKDKKIQKAKKKGRILPGF